ncbi:hypothetical protein AB1Y20_022825 [Prymnesium parvum]|uniref:Carbohydrate kinase PfkB domain-containing protein n=1 Tax=Prymnesium parvum TaxID=97485 RepID=A0AB34JDY5_PRYPA
MLFVKLCAAETIGNGQMGMASPLALLLLSSAAPFLSAHVLRVRPDIASAIEEGRPVVALESTIISHGMPFPENLETARAVEELILAHGALPATVAVLDGECCVGLTAEQLERFARLGAGSVSKCSRRDLAAVVARGGHAGTTVSATMLLAHRAGVRVFVTGGIGGVHRGGEASMDVSADLVELGRTPMTVVCAGAKSILDIPRTLEVLETQGVAVIALGADEFPAFFTRSSGVAAPCRLETPLQVARAAAASEALQLQSALLVGAPIPAEAEAEAAAVQQAIEAALDEVAAQGVGGREVTPYLLRRVNEMTAGASLKANIALVKNNAVVGAQVAVHLAALRAADAADATARAEGVREGVGGGEEGPCLAAPPSPPPSFAAHGAAVVIGGAVADLVASPARDTPLLRGTSTPGTLRISPGGVARNIAEALSRLGCPPLFLSALGDDALADLIVAHAEAVLPPLPTGSLLRVAEARTATFTALQDEGGDLCAAVADMEALQSITPEYISHHAAAIGAAPLCVVDANLSPAALACVASLCALHSLPLWLEPVSIVKAAAATSALHASRLLHAATFVSPNEAEAVAMAAALPHAPPPLPSLDERVAAAATALVHAGCAHVLVTRGARGVLWARRGAEGVEVEEVRALEARVVSTRGAGDAFVAGTVWGLLRHSREAIASAEAVRGALVSGLRAAQLTVEHEEAVPPTLVAERLS